MKFRFLGQSLLRLAGLAGVASLAIGCRAKPQTAIADLPPPTWRDKPAIDLSRGAAAFPLDATTRPTTHDELIAGLQAGYAARLMKDGPSARIQVKGDDVLRLKDLHISLTESKVDPKFVPSFNAKVEPAIGEIKADRVAYVATPLRYVDYDTNLTLTAEDATLALVPDAESKKISLSLVDARVGHARFAVKVKDLQKSLETSSRLRGGAAFAINDVEMFGGSDNPRSLEGYLRVHARVLLVPAKFRIGGRLDVDDNFNVRLTGLFCKGDDVGGAIVAGLVEPKVMKFDNVLMPLVRFPDDRMKVTGFNIKVDHSLTVDLDFARR